MEYSQIKIEKAILYSSEMCFPIKIIALSVLSGG
nr:MAG TPA: hypothetical protein [Caudoviricetes sp.]